MIIQYRFSNEDISLNVDNLFELIELCEDSAFSIEHRSFKIYAVLFCNRIKFKRLYNLDFHSKVPLDCIQIIKDFVNLKLGVGIFKNQVKLTRA